MNKLATAIVIAAAVILSAGCAEASIPETATEEPSNRLVQSTEAINEVVIGLDKALHCKDGLTSLVVPPKPEIGDLPSEYSFIDMGDTYVEINSYGKGESDLDVEIHGTPLNIKAAFIETRLSGDKQEFITSATGTGVTEVVTNDFDDYVVMSRYFTADWSNKLQLGFSVYAEDFGHGQQLLDSVTLCIAK